MLVRLQSGLKGTHALTERRFHVQTPGHPAHWRIRNIRQLKGASDGSATSAPFRFSRAGGQSHSSGARQITVPRTARNSLRLWQKRNQTAHSRGFRRSFFSPAATRRQCSLQTQHYEQGAFDLFLPYKGSENTRHLPDITAPPSRTRHSERVSPHPVQQNQPGRLHDIFSWPRYPHASVLVMARRFSAYNDVCPSSSTSFHEFLTMVHDIFRTATSPSSVWRQFAWSLFSFRRSCHVQHGSPRIIHTPQWCHHQVASVPLCP